MISVKKLIQYVMIVAFSITLSIPAIIMFSSPDKTISEQEKRELAQSPKFSLNQPFKKLVADTETYINDQFGYREDLVYWHSYLKMALLKKSPSERVLIGQGGWLYLTEPNQIQDYQGLITYTEEEKALWKDIFQGRKDWLAQRNIIYVVVIAPDKKASILNIIHPNTQ